MKLPQFLTGSIILLGVVFIILPSLLKLDPSLLYNPSPSAEIGWYRVHKKHAYHRGDLVASSLPSEAELLAHERGYLKRGTPVIKTVWAVSGDEICWLDGHVYSSEQPLIEVAPSDGSGRILTGWTSGCHILLEDEYFLASMRIPSSFDSRYFGPVLLEHIIGEADFIGLSLLRSHGNSGNGHWARAKGAEGKIKAHSAKIGLTPCLHIFFYSAILKAAAPRFVEIANGCKTIGQRYFTALRNTSQVTGR